MRPFPNDELLFDYKLSDLVRYNHRHKIKNESVAEHSYYVTLFCLKICSFYKFDDETTSRILTKAILHDLPEIETSDIPYNVKQNMPALAQLLGEAETTFYREHYPELYDIIYDGNELEDLVVKYADALSVMQYCLNELELSPGNKDFLAIKQDTTERLNKLRKEIDYHAEKQ